MEFSKTSKLIVNTMRVDRYSNEFTKKMQSSNVQTTPCLTVGWLTVVNSDLPEGIPECPIFMEKESCNVT